MDEVPTLEGRAVVFCCAACNAPLTKPLVEAPLNMDAKAPYESENRDWEARQPLGTYAIDPEPFGPPYVPVPGRIGYRNVHVPGGPRGTFVIAPSDALAMDPVPDPSRRSGCCGPSGSDGLNLRCALCGAEVATECADCWTYQEIVLDPGAVVLVGDGQAR